jgi:hypothetical protein
MIVVAVLTISCQVSENPKSGPLMAQPMIAAQHAPNVIGRPAAEAIRLEIRVKSLDVVETAAKFLPTHPPL